jgi:anaerobic ribonucleoside-triphosphate reductase activating protein
VCADLSERTAVLRLAHRVACSEAEGPHRRFAVWVQGCSLRCPGCCNAELFPREGGAEVEVAALARELRAARELHAVEGLTVLGGEPLEQLPAVLALCRAARGLGLGVLVFSGHTLAEISATPGGEALLAAVDTLVDGRFRADEREPADGRRFVGSRNQRLVHQTVRYADPALWRGPPAAEVHVGPDGALSVHGEPNLARRLVRGLRAGGARPRARA